MSRRRDRTTSCNARSSSRSNTRTGRLAPGAPRADTAGMGARAVQDTEAATAGTCTGQGRGLPAPHGERVRRPEGR